MNRNEPAFPPTNAFGEWHEQFIADATKHPEMIPFGLTKREYFAALAMQGLIRKVADGVFDKYRFYRELAVESVMHADALLKALENE